MTKIVLVRHGHVEGISPERFRGRADLALTPEGLRQAEATARRIEASWIPAALYASPLSRSRMTAEAIGRPFGLTPTAVPGLMDIDYGEWQGLTPDEVGQKWAEPLDTWYRAPHWAAIPGGESLQDVLARAVAALREVIGWHPKQTVVLVGHDSVNRIILLHALDLPLSRYRRLAQDPCAINEIDFSAGEFTVRSVNGVDHLKERR
ncbi:MAG TPA: histidine phosphatase family protein [Stellaceae bacterium]|jgi:probable phosphoglycerate mutase|nr:histidine phosphatase family protein [Stellaceae bacterium]HEX3416960.1 histidine phosphatase family protein [Stellaceae bacterium]